MVSPFCCFSVLALFLVLCLIVSSDSMVCRHPSPYASFLSQLYNISLQNSTNFTNPVEFSSLALNSILMAGSHDAGLWSVEPQGLGVFLPKSYFKTQNLVLLDQLCMGSRWFDIRLDKISGVYKCLHGSEPIFAYGETLDSLIKYQKTFFTENQKEIVFWRIKLGPYASESEIASKLRQEFKDYMVDKLNENTTLQSMTLGEIWNHTLGGSLAIMSHGWTAPPVEVGKRQGWIWDYEASQYGEFSDAYSLSGMLNRCESGQVPQLEDYKDLSYNNTNHPLIGIWWTFTTGEIEYNTNNQIASAPQALYDFYHLADGEIGNFLIVDFIEKYPDLLKIVWKYNYNKYVVYPPLSPTDGLKPVDPRFPESGFHGECVWIPSATTTFTATVIAVFCVVVVVIIAILITIIAFVVKKYKKSKRKTEFLLN